MRMALSWTRGAPAAREKAWSASTRAAASARAVSESAPGAGGERRRSNVAGALMASAYSHRVRDLAVQALRRLDRGRRRPRARLGEDGEGREQARAQIAQRLLAARAVRGGRGRRGRTRLQPLD